MSDQVPTFDDAETALRRAALSESIRVIEVRREQQKEVESAETTVKRAEVFLKFLKGER